MTPAEYEAWLDDQVAAAPELNAEQLAVIDSVDRWHATNRKSAA